MTILITGAEGYVGSQIAHALYGAHDTVIGVDNGGIPHKRSCPLPHGFQCYEGDIGEFEFMADILDRHEVRQIIHCAAHVSVPESVKYPLMYWQNNTVATFNLIDVATQCGVESFVFSSTAAVYGQPEFPRPIREDDPTRPISPYGRSKLAAEHVIRDACAASDMNAVILRYFNVAGADPAGLTGPVKSNATHLMIRAVRAALGMGNLEIYGDGTQVRDYIHVADLAEAHLAALRYLTTHQGCLTLNVGSGTGFSVSDVTRTVAEVAETRYTSVVAHRRDGDPEFVVADTRLIKEKFGWTPKYTLEHMVEHALAWERNRC